LLGKPLAVRDKKWSGLFNEAMKTPRRDGPPDPDVQGRDRYLAALRSSAPQQWASDHLRESQRLIGPVYVAIKVLGDQAASAEWKAYKWHSDARMGGDQDAKEPLPRTHPLSRLLLHPNRHDSGGNLNRRCVQQLCLTGTSLQWRVNNGLKTPVERWSVPTGTYQPVPPSARYPDGAYRIAPFWPGPLAMIPGAWNQGGIVVPSSRIIAIRHPHPLIEHEGLSPLSACSLALDTVQGIDEARFSRMRQNTSPSATAETDPQVLWPQGDELARLRLELQQFAGPANAGKIALLSPGVTLKPWGGGPIEIGWIESWNQLVGFVLSIFGVTKSLAFMSEDASYATLYASLKQFNLYTLCPILDMIAQGLNHQLIWPYWGEDYFVELVPRPIDDHQISEDQLKTDIQIGARTYEEIRNMRNLPKIDEPWVKERAIIGAKFTPPPPEGGQPGEAPPGAPEAGENMDMLLGGGPNAERPENDQGQGSLGGEGARDLATPHQQKAFRRFAMPLLNGNGNGRH